MPFLTGLLINCFILSAVYSFGKNLWLCAMTHALINTFSQTLAEGSTVIPGLAAKAAIVVIAVIVSGRMKRRDADVPA
ncbi:MAG: hypothetical protein ILP19_07505 [Oscillospiraceae bacterium]|nr:hypothetical protein [Oscillospiraceae bacterium]